MVIFHSYVKLPEGNGCSSLVVYSVFEWFWPHPHSWFLDEFVCSSIDVLRRPSSIYFTWGLISTSGSSISWGVVISATRHSVQPQKIVGNGWLSVDRSKTRNVDGAMVLCPWKIERRLNKWAVRKKKTEKHGWDCSSYPSVGHTKGLHPGSWHPGYIIFSIKRIKFKQKTCRGSKPVGPE